MDFMQAKDLILTALAGYIGIQIRTMAKSVESLNITVAKLLVRVEGQGDTIKEHGSRIRRLEKKS